jgi:hypothetical protein
MAVYFITDGEYIKIGKAKDPQERLNGLQTGNPKNLFIIATINGDEAVEYQMHHRFKQWHHRGEWFKATPEMIKKISEVCQ